MGSRTVPRKPIPAYRKQKRPKGRVKGYVELNGRRHYLPGPYGSAESRQSYHRLLAEWEAHNGRLPVDVVEVTVSELAAAFWQHAETYYRRLDGSISHGAGVKAGVLRDRFQRKAFAARNAATPKEAVVRSEDVVGDEGSECDGDSQASGSAAHD